MDFRSRVEAYRLCEQWEDGEEACPIAGLKVDSVDSPERDFGQLRVECQIRNLEVLLKVNLAEDLFVLVEDARLEQIFKERRAGMRGAVVPLSARSMRRIRRSDKCFVTLLASAVFAIEEAIGQ